MQDDFKVLLAAYACEPNKGSEPEVGWQMSCNLARAKPEFDFYAITKKNNQEAIEKEIYPDNLHFIYYQPPKWLTWWKKGGRGIRTYYYIWMICATLHLRKNFQTFDVIHHVTFVNDWLPSFFCLLKSKNNKFIWGPIGSHSRVNAKFLTYSFKKRVIENIRISLQLVFRSLDPFFLLTKNKADIVVGISDVVKNNLSLDIQQNFVVEPAIASIPFDNDVLKAKDDKDLFTVLTVGRFVYFKNFRLSIEAFALALRSLTDKRVELKIIGSGSEQSELEDLVVSLDLVDSVKFLGQLSHQSVLREFANADLFLFPTLESAGFVVLEAMAAGLPVVALNYGGPGALLKSNIEKQLVDPSASYEDIKNKLAERVTFFISNNGAGAAIGESNKKDALTYHSWEEKVARLLELYN